MARGPPFPLLEQDVDETATVYVSFRVEPICNTVSRATIGLGLWLRLGVSLAEADVGCIGVRGLVC